MVILWLQELESLGRNMVIAKRRNQIMNEVLCMWYYSIAKISYAKILMMMLI